MIIADSLCKRFDSYLALNSLSCTINDGCIYGMVGSNGAGKSTFLRLIAGVYRPDGGCVTIDGVSVYNNPDVKKRIAYVPDELYFLQGASIDRMISMYQSIYPSFDPIRCYDLVKNLGLDPKKNIGSFSKGMKRQAATALALALRSDYIFFDETFDGLDPMMRNYVKSLICADVVERNATAIITSHSLRELEDTCDQLALLHKGGLVLQSDIANLKTAQFKVQIAFLEEYDKSKFDTVSEMQILQFSKQGSVSNLIVKGDKEVIVSRLKQMQPILLDVLPLSLEEVFTYEMESLGYTFSLNEGGQYEKENI